LSGPDHCRSMSSSTFPRQCKSYRKLNFLTFGISLFKLPQAPGT
jgi:hypothetical protein